MKYTCWREIREVSGSQSFEVNANSEGEARKLFAEGGGVLVESECEVVSLDDYDLDTIELSE